MTAVRTLEELTTEFENAYKQQTPGSARLFEEAKEIFPGGETRNSVFFRPHPLYIKEAHGSHMYDVDGNDYIDFTNCMTALMLGHAHPKVVAAATEQIAKGTALASANPYAQELAKLVMSRQPSLERFRFTNTGSEATLLAVRAARAFSGKPRILKFGMAYHGMGDIFNVEMDGQAAGVTPGAASEVLVSPYNDLDTLEQLVSRYKDELACVIMDVNMAGASMVQPVAGFVKGVREITQRHGVLMVMDEVISFRFSYGGAQEVFGVKPDLTAMGKIIGGGFPVGAFGGRAEIMDVYNMGKGGYSPHAGTFNGNPITSVAGIAQMTELTRETIDGLNARSERTREGLRAAIAKAGLRAKVVGVGSMVKIQFTPDEIIRPNPQADTPALLHLVHLGLLKRGIYATDRMWLNLSTVVTDEELDRFVAAVGEVCAEIALAVRSYRPDLVA